MLFLFSLANFVVPSLTNWEKGMLWKKRDLYETLSRIC